MLSWHFGKMFQRTSLSAFYSVTLPNQEETSPLRSSGTIWWVFTKPSMFLFASVKSITSLLWHNLSVWGYLLLLIFSFKSGQDLLWGMAKKAKTVDVTARLRHIAHNRKHHCGWHLFWPHPANTLKVTLELQYRTLNIQQYICRLSIG